MSNTTFSKIEHFRSIVTFFWDALATSILASMSLWALRFIVTGHTD